MNNKRLQIYDSIKGIAILGVICCHLQAWFGIPNDTNMLGEVIKNGYWGVELTYLINGTLYAKSYNQKKLDIGFNLTKYVARMIFRIIPIYYFAMVTNAICSFVAKGTAGAVSIWDIISHFLFCNVLNPYWFNSFFGGSGYIGVLVLMWIIYPLYLEKIDNLKKSVCAIFVFWLFLPILQQWIIRFFYLKPVSNIPLFNNWIVYIIRAIYSFAFGNLLYHLGKIETNELFKTKYRKLLFCIAILVYLIYKLTLESITTFEFLAIWAVLIWINMDNSIFLIDNRIIAFFGKYIFELFINHILLFYILESHFQVFDNKVLDYVLISILSVVLSITMFHIKKIVNSLFHEVARRKQRNV